MTAPRAYNEPPPLLTAAPEVRTGAGTPVTLPLTITNRASEPRIIALATLGVDAEWLPKPSRSRVVLPGESVVADLTLNPSVGTVPARYPLAVAVQALDPVEQRATSVTAVSEIVLTVDAPGQVDVSLEPQSATAVFGKRVRVLVQNSGLQPEQVHLEVRAPHSIRVHLPADRLEVPPGRTVSLPGRLKVARAQFWGTKSRNTYTVTARSAGAPKHAEGAFTVRPILGPFGTKVGLVTTVIALWVALAIVFIPKLADKVRNTVAAPATTSATSTSTSTAPPKGGRNGGGTGGQNGGGTGGGGGGGNGGNGGNEGGGKNGGKAAPAAQKQKTLQLNGVVTGDSPGGATVQIRPTSLVDEEAEGAQQVPHIASTAAVGKIPQSALLLTAPTTVSADRSLTTPADGTWSFSKVKRPGYYLLTVSKFGYQEVRYVIDSASAAAAEPLKVALVPGQGRLTGTVTGPTGQVVGGAQVTISDGTNTITTSSNSRGSVGQWQVDGLSTPDSYLVSVSKNGMSTESSLVDLAAGARATVDLRLHVGVASLTGMVKAVDSTGNWQGLGGATVTATNGSTSHTATTVTTGSLEGEYILPDLAPGTYTITVSATGYLTQTKQKVIGKNASGAVVNADLNPSSAVVTGTVRGTGIGPIVGAGLTMSSKKNTYKITSGSGGAFRFNGVAPGSYTISAEYFNRVTSYHTVKAVVGRRTTAVHFLLKPTVQVNTSTIAGFVGNATSSGGTLGCTKNKQGRVVQGCTVRFMLFDSLGHRIKTHLKDGDPYRDVSTAAAAQDGPTGYRISAQGGLAPGLYRLTAGSEGFLPATIGVRVPLDGTASAPQINLFPANTISGTVDALGDISQDVSGNPIAEPNCVWAIPHDSGANPPKSCAPPPGGEKNCTNFGNATASVVTMTGNSYELTGLCDGSYDIYFVIKNPIYHAPEQAGKETVQHGQTVDYSPHIPRYGRVILSFTDTNGNPITGQFAVTASCQPSSATGISPTSTSADGTATVYGVHAGTASCQVDASPSGTQLHGEISQVPGVSDDHDVSATITLAKNLNTVFGHVVTHYGDTSDSPHAIAENTPVTIAGVTKYDGTRPVSDSRTVHTNKQGCFAIVQPGTTLDPGLVPAACGTLDASSTTTLSLVNRKLYDPSGGQDGLDIPATSVTQPFSATSYIVDDTQLNTIAVMPIPAKTANLTVGVDPTGTPDPASIDLSQAQVTIDSSAVDKGDKTATPTGTLAASGPADGSRALIWRDNDIASGTTAQAWPGTYSVKIHVGGYLDATAEVDCPTPGGDCSYKNNQAPVLKALGALSGTVTSTDPGTGITQLVSNATITAKCLSANPDPCKPTATFTVKANAAGFYSFADSTNHYFMSRSDWTITASAPSFAGWSRTVQITGGDQVQDIALDELASLSGHITGSGLLNPTDTVPTNLGPVGNATIKAYCKSPSGSTLCPTSGPGSSATDPITVTSDASGGYTMPASGGDPLAPGTWSFTISANGYTTHTFDPVSINSGTNANKDFSLDAYGRLTGTVYGRGANNTQLAAIAGAKITATCTTSCTNVGGPYTTTSDASGNYSFPTDGIGYLLDPTATWTFTVSDQLDGYSDTDNTGITIKAGANSADLFADALGRLDGVVSGAGGLGLSGASVKVQFCDVQDSTVKDGDQTCATSGDSGTKTTTSTDGAGNYTISNPGGAYSLKKGKYQLTVTASGYTTYTTVLSIDSGPNIKNVALLQFATITGTVTGLNGNPLSSARVVAVECTSAAAVPADCTPKSGTSITVNTDGSGDFTVKNSTGLDAGTWRLTVSFTGYQTAQAIVSVSSGAADAGTIALTAYATVTGTITGCIDTPTACSGAGPVVQNLSGATVTAHCVTPADPDAPCPATDPTATSVSDGSYNFTAGQKLVPGTWNLTVGDTGYTSKTLSSVTINGGTNSGPDFNTRLAVILVDIPIGIQVNGTTTKTCHVTLKITRHGDTAESYTLYGDAADSPSGTSDCDSTDKTFSVPGGLVPATYDVSITGGSSPVGQSVFATSGTFFVPFSDDGTAAEADLPVTIVQNKVTGHVDGAFGGNAPFVLANVPVQLGHLASDGTTFIPDDAINETPLVACTDSGGKFTFSGVPNSTTAYVARINSVANTGCPVVYGYAGGISAASATINFSAGDLGTTPLTGTTQNVTVSVQADAGDDLTGISTGDLALTSSDANVGSPLSADAWTTSDAATGSYTIQFNSVPFGCWSFAANLPSGHPGDVSGPDSADQDANGETCGTGEFSVWGTGTHAAQPGYTVDEHQLTIKVTLDTLPGQDSDAPDSVTAAVSGPITRNPSITPGTAKKLWVTAGTYDVSVSATPSAAWPDPAAQNNLDLSSSGQEADFTLTEAPATLRVANYPGNAANNPPIAITLQCTGGQSYPTGCDTAFSPTPATDTTGNGVTLTTDLAPGDWTVTITWTSGSGGSATTHTYTDDVTLTAGVRTTTQKADWVGS